MNRSSFTALALACSLAIPVQAKTLSIALDLSGSNPLIVDPQFAENAAKYAANQVVELDYKDSVRLMYFGARSNAKNLHGADYTISKRHRAKKVAKLVGQQIAALPEHKNIGQSETNIRAFLELTSGFDCANGSHILVITDGLEATKKFSAQAFMRGELKLPKPDVDLKGCSVTFYGLGVGWDLKSVKTVRNAWREYFAAAGARFNVISR